VEFLFVPKLIQIFFLHTKTPCAQGQSPQSLGLVFQAAVVLDCSVMDATEIVLGRIDGMPGCGQQ
jgi:hypothetical protein